MHRYEMILQAIGQAGIGCTDKGGIFNSSLAIEISKRLYNDLFLEPAPSLNGANESAEPAVVSSPTQHVVGADNTRSEICSNHICDYCEGNDACLACDPAKGYSGFIGRKLSELRVL